MKALIHFLRAGLVGLCVAASVLAQADTKGTLNAWTTKPVARQRADDSETRYLRSVRAMKREGFDRVVFEFQGSLPDYSLQYLPSRFYTDDGGTRPITISGDVFLFVDLHPIPAVEKQVRFSRGKDFFPKGELNLPSLVQLEDKGLFEGDYSFLLGVKAHKAFRVTELSHPARLVIDIKH